MRVSIIIPVLDDFRRLRLCLDALAGQTWPREGLEVVVVDNGSREDVVPAVAEFPFVRVLREARPGSYVARNTGIRAAKGEVFAFTDSDCVPQPNWIEAGVRALRESGPNSVIGGRVNLFVENSDSPTLAEEFDLATGFSQQIYVEKKRYAVTANLFTTPEVFEAIGLFNAELRSGGDKQWGLRAHAAGMTLRYSDHAVVRHPARRSLRELMRKRARVVAGHYGIARERHPGWVAFPQVFVQSCLPPVRQALTFGRGIHPSPGAPSSWQSTLRVVGVSTTLRAYSALELVRLQLGKPAER